MEVDKVADKVADMVAWDHSILQAGVVCVCGGGLSVLQWVWN